jgi:uridine kinase
MAMEEVIEMTDVYGDLLDRLDLPPAGTVVVVGPSGSGKSTLAAEVAGRLGAALISTDDLLIPEAERSGPGLLAKYDLGALDAALARLQAGRPAELVPFDQQTRQRVGHKVMAPSASGAIVVEGIVALYAARVLATSSLALYVDAPSEVREARQIARLDREGWYRDLPREAIEARIRAKRAAEDTIVSYQLGDCQYAIDTAGAVPSILPIVAAVAA